MRKKLLINIILIVFTSIEGYALNIKHQLVNTYPFENFHNIILNEGGRIVTEIVQDSNGIVWFGTNLGLYNYNGFNSCRYWHAGYEDENIQAMRFIDKCHLYIASNTAGLSLFNTRIGRFENVPKKLKRIRSVHSLAYIDNKLWIGCQYDGLYSYDFKTGKLIYHNIYINGYKAKRINCIKKIGNQLFVATYKGLAVFRYNKNLTQVAGSFAKMTYDLKYDSKSRNIYLGTDHGLYIYNINTRKIEKSNICGNNSISSIAFDNHDRMFFSTDNGLYVYNRNNGSTIRVRHLADKTRSLINNTVNKVFIDCDDGLWAGTNAGISMQSLNTDCVNIRTNDMMGSSEGNIFSRIFIDSRRRYWLGGEDGLMLMTISPNGSIANVENFNEESTNHNLTKNDVRDIYEDHEHNIWICTMGGGLARYDENTHQFINYNIIDRTGLRRAIWAINIAEDKYGRLWLTTDYTGLFVINKKKLIANGYSKPYIALNNITDKMGNMSLLGSALTDIEPIDDNLFWINTKHGLTSVDINKFRVTRYNIKRIWNVFRDTERNLYFAHYGDIYKMKYGKNPELISNNAEHGTFNSFTKWGKNLILSTPTGLELIDIITHKVSKMTNMDVCYSSIYDKTHHIILCGSKDGIFLLNPKSRIKSRQVLISSITVDGEKNINWEGLTKKNFNISIKRGNDVTIELFDGDYSSPENKQFYYRTDMDKTWNSLDVGQNKINLIRPSAGHHKIYLCNMNPCYNNAHISEYTLYVPYPWYETWIAIIIYAIVIILCILLLMKRAQRNSKLKYERMEKEKTLELANRKMDFFINISHELKTPLTLIIGPLANLLNQTKNAELKLKLSSIYDNSLKLNKLIHKVLDVTKAKYEEEDLLTRTNIELCSLVKGYVDRYMTAIHEKKVEITFDTNIKSLWLNLDSVKINSIIANIISNAVKFVPSDNGIIRIYLVNETDKVNLIFVDNGSGFDVKSINHVFERYFQSIKDNNIKEGSGIGLYLVKKFVTMHEGSVTVGNNTDSNGARVVVTFPTIGKNAIRTTKVKEDKIDDNTTEDKILIIDDNSEMVDFITELLGNNYSCLSASNGKEGLDVSKNEQVDLIIVDEMMPIMNGMTFCKMLREYKPTASIPVIMLTAKDDAETEMQSIKAGADAFIPKPFDVKKLKLRIAQLIRNHEIIEESTRIQSLSTPELNTLHQKQISADEELINLVNSTIEENLSDEDLSVEKLCTKVGIGQRTLNRKFKQMFDITVVNYIRQVRMKNAAMLLQQNRYNISEVMYMVGFSNASYFTRIFHKEYGVTPSQYVEKEHPE